MLDPPYVHVTLKPGAWVDPAKMTQAIRDSGFTPVPEDVRLVLAGTLEARDGRFVLVLSGMRTPREVICVPAAGKDGDAATAALADHAGRAAIVSGRWRSEDGGRLEVTSIAP
jgi:hypothetical protein